ncbi:MAG: hypothetical protein AAF962_10620 [Actinomycetota bacterium]
MSETYIGWDGKQYPWPPPDGWYEAIDGRYWAPGTGPNPPPQGAGTGSDVGVDQAAAAGAGAVGGAGAAAPVVGSSGAPADAGLTSQLPVQDPTRATVQQPYGTGPQATPDTVNYGSAGGPEGAPGVGPVGAPEKKGGGILQAILIVFGMVAVAILGGLAYFYLTNNADESTATGDTIASEAGDETADDPAEPVDEEPADGTTTTAAPDDGTEEPEPDDTTPDDSDEEPEPESTTTTTAAATPELGQFRQILSDNGLTSQNLTDDNITTFADSFCGMAAEAADAAEFDLTRESSVAATNSNLSDEELRLVIDAAIVSFCPDQAQRLGIQP